LVNRRGKIRLIGDSTG